MKSLYLECNAGISGDMLVAALLDLGADKEALDKALQSIPAKGFEYKISRVSKAGVDCCDFDVILDEEHANHDHDMAFLHGNGDAVVYSHEHEHHHDHEHEHEHEHHHDHEHCHEHEHSHVPHEHHHHHEHRGLQEVIAIIDATDMSAAAKELALKIFDIIADAEAKAHAVEKNAVHFHEVGAIDSIVDIVAIAVCADSLGVENVIVPELCEGRGTVRCQHGVLPVPVPATANIMQRFGFNVRLLPVQGEFVTPTGAAAAADGTAFVFMGHGTSHTAKISYSQMQTTMQTLGYDNVFIGTVEGEPEDTACDAVIEKVKEAGYTKVILRPLMVVAGDHANNDMAGSDEDSWLSQFNAAGCFDSVDTQIAGLGEIADVQQLYVDHTKAAIDSLNG